MKIDLEHSMFFYMTFIKVFEKTLIEKYNVQPIYEKIGFQIPRSDEIRTDEFHLYYRFHGRGCSIFFYGLGWEVDYTFNLSSNNYIVLSSYEFLKFIKSTSRRIEGEMNIKNDIMEFIKEFNEKGILKKEFDMYETYHISERWYMNYTAKDKP